MSRIIQPFGKILQRVTFEVDVHRKLKVTAVHIDPATDAEITMSIYDAVMLALGFARDMVPIMAQQAASGQQQKKIIDLSGGEDGEAKPTTN